MDAGTDKRAEASRAKHKFAVKRNSWPKTRGVAMNPVDHVSLTTLLLLTIAGIDSLFSSLTVVVTTSISVKPRPSPATPHRVKRPVSSPRGERVCCVVRRRRRTRGLVDGDEVWCFWGRLDHSACFRCPSSKGRDRDRGIASANGTAIDALNVRSNFIIPFSQARPSFHHLPSSYRQVCIKTRSRAAPKIRAFLTRPLAAPPSQLYWRAPASGPLGDVTAVWGSCFVLKINLKRGDVARPLDALLCVEFATDAILEDVRRVTAWREEWRVWVLVGKRRKG